jgi:hypothetical protein
MPDYRGGTADAPVAFDRPTCDHRIGSDYFDVFLDCSLATNFRCRLGECAHQLQDAFDRIASWSGYRSIGNDVCPVFRWDRDGCLSLFRIRAMDPTAPPPGTVTDRGWPRSLPDVPIAGLVADAALLGRLGLATSGNRSVTAVMARRRLSRTTFYRQDRPRHASGLRFSRLAASCRSETGGCQASNTSPRRHYQTPHPSSSPSSILRR